MSSFLSSITDRLTWENAYSASLQCEKILLPILEVSAVSAAASLIFSVSAANALEKTLPSLHAITPLVNAQPPGLSVNELKDLVCPAPFFAPFPLNLWLNQSNPTVGYLIDWSSRIAAFTHAGLAVAALSFKVTCVAACLLLVITVIRDVAAHKTNQPSTWDHWKPWVSRRLPVEVAAVLGFGVLSVLL